MSQPNTKDRVELDDAIDRLLTVAQVAARLACSQRTVRSYLASGRLLRVRLSPRAVRIRESELARFLASCEEGQ
ncbi:MAG: helix-turn-helix domain-containing protein [Planctomycetes bacterium]|nr:helix-turn-helix domain-containing protein [Planctomycetota bacterium]